MPSDAARNQRISQIFLFQPFYNPDLTRPIVHCNAFFFSNLSTAPGNYELSNPPQLATSLPINCGQRTGKFSHYNFGANSVFPEKFEIRRDLPAPCKLSNKPLKVLGHTQSYTSNNYCVGRSGLRSLF